MTSRAVRPAALAPILLIALIALAAAVPATRPIGDPDFFWHLETGRWIAEHRALPDRFLFSLTTPETLDAARRFTMTSYWAAQLLSHGMHAAAGMAGIAVLRAALVLMILGTLLLRREGDRAVFLASALLAVLAMRLYLFERPQVLSFLFFSLLLLLLDRVRASPAPRAAAAAIPPLMLLWANCHGAFPLGQATIVGYIALEGAKTLHPSLGPLPRGRLRLLAVAGVAGVAAALVNPNGWHPLRLAFLPAWQTADNVEYLSSLEHFRLLGAAADVVLWALLALGALAVVLAGRSDLTRSALVLATGVLSWMHVRHAMFFVLAAAPFVAGVLSRGRFRGTAGRAAVATALAAGLAFAPGDLRSLPDARHLADVNPLAFPVDAADFVSRAGVRGNLYNFSNWGGYLLWRLAPARVFMDGRNSVEAVARMNEQVERADPAPVAGGLPAWKAILAAHGVRYAVLPIWNPTSGDVLPLTIALLRDPGWVPVFAGLNAAVFVAVGPENAGVVARHARPRGPFLAGLVDRAQGLVRSAPGYLPARVALGDLLLAAGRREEALRAYEDALARLPGHPVLGPKAALLRASLRS